MEAVIKRHNEIVHFTRQLQFLEEHGDKSRSPGLLLREHNKAALSHS
jgi:hypothetical protein